MAEKSQNPRISIVVALGNDHKHNNRLIGKTNELVWRIPDDQKRFKNLTMGHPVVMGRKTYDSIFAALHKPLPGRTSIVVTRSSEEIKNNSQYMFENVRVAGSLEEAVAKAKGLDSEEIFIGGGSQIYEQALPLVDRLYLTLIDDEKEGDAYFPPYAHLFTKMIAHEDKEHKGLKYKFVDLERE